MGLDGLARAWWVTREADRRGNAIHYRYRNDVDADGHTYAHAIERIDYTDHPSSPASRAVRFELFTWSTYPGYPGFTGGMWVDRSLRLRRIVTLGPNDVPVSRYELQYDQSPATGRARLTSITECTYFAGGGCKPPTRFGWKTEEPGALPIRMRRAPHDRRSKLRSDRHRHQQRWPRRSGDQPERCARR